MQKRVLIVDDERSLRRTLTFVFARAGSEVLATTLTPGLHQIRVSAFGFVPLECEAETRDHSSLGLRVELQPLGR